MSWIPSYKKPGGGLYTPPTWADGTDAEIIEALEKHYAGEIDLTEFWSVGDERVISLSAMEQESYSVFHYAQDVTFVISEVGGKILADGVTECAFQVDQKDSLGLSTSEVDCMNSVPVNNLGWVNTPRYTWCNGTYYNSIPSTIRPIFKQFTNYYYMGNKGTSIGSSTDYFALRAEVEVFGTSEYSIAGEGSQVEWYKTSSNRIKKVYILDYGWWLRSPANWKTTDYCYVSNTGTISNTSATSTIGIAPFGVI